METNTTAQLRTANKFEIKDNLEHRDPFLLVDEVLDLQENEIIARWDVAADNPIFSGHFPDYPVVPGVLLIEAMAQTAALLILLNNPELKRSRVAVASFDRARFRNHIQPPAEVALKARCLKKIRQLYVFECAAYWEGREIASVQITGGPVDWNPRQESKEETESRILTGE